jgi:cell division inhibitor SepF
VNNLWRRLGDFVGLGPSSEYDEEYEEISEAGYQSSYSSDASEPTVATPVTTAREELRQRSVESISRSSINPSTINTSIVSTPMNGTNNVIGMPTSKLWGTVAEVIVMEPRKFEEMPQVIQALKERKSVVLNLTMMEPEQAQRAVDFVAGATYTIDGHQERIGESIFLFTPSCVNVKTHASNSGSDPREAPHPLTPMSRPNSSPAPDWGNDPMLSRVAQ